jgi:hypothetical protein
VAVLPFLQCVKYPTYTRPHTLNIAIIVRTTLRVLLCIQHLLIVLASFPRLDAHTALEVPYVNANKLATLRDFECALDEKYRPFAKVGLQYDTYMHTRTQAYTHATIQQNTYTYS